MRVFVTGGSGFIGGHVIEKFTAAGHEVVALARSESSEKVVKGYGATPVRGDLNNLGASMMQGCEAVIHAAAFVEEWGTRAEFEDANVHGTQRALDAAKAAGVKRFILVGTEAALFNGADLNDVDETAPYANPQRFLYPETKAEAERRVLAANSTTFTTISIRPRLVWGPRDASVLPAVLEVAQKGGWAWFDGGTQRTSTTHVFNLVKGLELALTQGRGGEAYFVCDDGTTTMHEFLSASAMTRGVKLPERSVPKWLMRGLAALIEGAWKLFGLKRRPPFTRFSISMMSASVTVNASKAKRELGYTPVLSVADGLAALRS